MFSHYLLLGTILFFSLHLVNSVHSRSRAPKCSIVSIPPVSASIKEENMQLTRQINKHLKLWQLGIISTEESTHSTNLSLALLKLVAQVVKAVCPNPFVPHLDIIDGALTIFTFLHDNTGGIRHFEDPITPPIFARIAPALINCQKTVIADDSYFKSTDNASCPLELSTVRELCNKDAGFDVDVEKCRKLKLRQEKRGGTECFQNTNLLLDIVWNMVEIVHVACVKEFQKWDDIMPLTDGSRRLKSYLQEKSENIG